MREKRDRKRKNEKERGRDRQREREKKERQREIEREMKKENRQVWTLNTNFVEKNQRTTRQGESEQERRIVREIFVLYEEYLQP